MSEFSDATKASLAALLASAGVDDEDTVDYVVGLAEAGEWEALPEFLEGVKIYSLDLGSLMAGTRYRGDFEDIATRNGVSYGELVLGGGWIDAAIACESAPG